jgi:opacity protein-like surface antigen
MTISSPTLRAVALCAASLCACSAAWSQNVPDTVLLAQATVAPVVAEAAPKVAAKTPAEKDAANAKRWSVYWGWNRSNYSNSDIHFKGVDHDFTLRDVQATDRPGEFGLDSLFETYLNPGNLSLPQTNLRVAYQYSADTAIALNLDHMKYVMVQDVSVPISGQINGVAQSGQQVLADNWMTFEHTDGLNIISLEIEKQRPVGWFGANYKSKVFGLAGVGIALPKSNVRMGMINQQRNDEFHVAGYSLSVGGGLEVDVWKDLFLRAAYKFGYVDLPDVLTSARGDKASQHFTFNELIFAVGWRF